jgi:hypothetical protein
MIAFVVLLLACLLMLLELLDYGFQFKPANLRTAAAAFSTDLSPIHV